MINLSLPYRPLLKKLYWFARTAVFGLAALYIAMSLVYAVSITGAGFDTLAFTARNLQADAFDMASVLRYKIFGIGLGIGTRPMRYALICEPPGATEAENASNEQRVRRQLREHSGALYNEMKSFIEQGGTHPVLLLSQVSGGAKICAASAYRTQTCSCGGKFDGVERSRIPARELFGPS